ncbi:DUF2339 domain-containing protein [Sphingomonas sp. KC8]|uniref:DUF2339 domain-containing protein n=1 Tax=Sphingomonas sp. KC8 TaxID=1030157 RepID=UPI0002488AE9|nr:DUF2339 domain-containing protein [Sphingomonas sp. KC8]ARS27947.1 hypothetical protein KC8_11700 [Sphingomonas sp. KC8]
MLEFWAIVGLIIAVAMLRGRISRAEQRIVALGEELRELRLASDPAVAPAMAQPIADPEVIAEPEPVFEPVATPELRSMPEVQAVAQTAVLAETAAIPKEDTVPPPPPTPARPPVTSRVFEELFGSRLPIWAGGVTLAVAGFFLVKYSIDTGLLSPAIRVILAMLFAVGLVGGAEAARRIPMLARDPRVAQALAGAGIAVAYIAVLIAANLYGLIAPLTAFVGLATVTAAAIGLALRFGAPSAVLGLVGGLSAPALAGGTEAHAPVLALYLMLVIAAIAGVSRRQGWLWLSIAALIGGFGWGALLIATSVIDVATAGAVGVLLLVLAFGVPVLAAGSDAGDPARWLRAGTVVAAAVQLALLVVQGGFAPLVWGFYGLLAIGAVVLARIDPRQWMLPPVALGVALIVLMLWPAPSLPMLVAVAGGVIAIFAAPALIDAWHPVRGRISAAQGAAALIGAVGIGWLHFPELLGGSGWGVTALAFAAAPGLAAARGWGLAQRRDDWRFALLSTASGVLVAIAAALALPDAWLPPIFAGIACALAWLARKAEDALLEWAPRALGLVAVLHLGLLGADGGLANDAAVNLRLFLTAALFVVAGHIERNRWIGAPWLVFAALLAVRILFNILPVDWTPVVCAMLALGLALVADHRETIRARPAAATFAAIGGVSMAAGLAIWLEGSAAALVGAFVFAGDLPLPTRSLLLMGGPALAIIAMLLRTRAVPLPALRAALFVFCGVTLAATGHVLFKQIFAIAGEGEAIAYAFAERVILTQLLFAAGVAALWQQARHPLLRVAGVAVLALAAFRLVWFDLLLFAPVLRDQAVGPWPIVNLLLLAYGLPLIWIGLFKRLEPDFAALLRKPVTALAMALVLMLVAASVRQFFEGSVLTGEGVSPNEDIARSIAGIVLAIGFLRYGIARGGKAWRIAALVLMLATVLKVFGWDAKGLEGLLRIGSFVALGFSLIGIGFLYNRYLVGSAAAPSAE